MFECLQQLREQKELKYIEWFCLWSNGLSIKDMYQFSYFIYTTPNL